MQKVPKRIEAVYQDALANIMFIRKQQWTVTGYVLAAQAAVYIVAKESAEQWVKILFVFFAALGGLYGIVALRELSAGLKKFRDRLEWIYDNAFTADERAGLALGYKHSKRNDWVFDGLYGVIIVAAIVTGLGILFLKQQA